MHKIHVLGAGAIGLFHAQYLNRIPNSVVLLKRKAAEQKCSIQITTMDRSVLESECEIDSPSGKGQVETLLVCTKANDALSAIQQYAGRLKKRSNIVLLTNGGLQVKDDVQQYLQLNNIKTNIISGLTTHGVRRTGEYAALHTGAGETCLGVLKEEDPELAKSILAQLQEAFKPINFAILEPAELHERLLLKTLVNACINPLTAILSCRNGEILNQWGIGLIHKTAKEIKSVTPELDKFTDEELKQMVLKVAKNTFENTNSMLVDINEGRLTEIDFLNGDKSFNRNKLYIDTSIGAANSQQQVASPLPPAEWPQETTPFFLPTTSLVVLYAADNSMQLFPKIKPKMDRGFFITPNGTGNDWTCYRRNYFQISSAFVLEDQDGIECNVPCYLEDQGTSYPVESFAIGIDAKVFHGDRKIGIIQHTPKRDKGPQITPTPKELLAGGNPFQYSGLSASKFVATFERLQFKSATANNGKRRAAQQFFTVILDLFAVVNGKHIKIATCESSQLVVRGRSPGHYSDNAAESPVHFHEMQPTKNADKSPTEEHSPYPPNSANSLVSPYPYLTPESRFTPYPTATSTSSSWLRSRGDSAESLQSYITNDSYASSFEDSKTERQANLSFNNAAFPRLAHFSPVADDSNKFQQPFPRENRFYSGLKNAQLGQVLSPVTPIATDALIPPSVEDNHTPDFDGNSRFTYDGNDRSYNNRMLRLPKGVGYSNEDLYTQRQDSFQTQDSFQRQDSYNSQDSFQHSFENRETYQQAFTDTRNDNYSAQLYSVDNFGNNSKMEYTQSQTESQ
ncbi:hypothetical protein HK103_000084 [Boothiomyces macroporosus]|uniref:NDT80 domain-containing protein n=1 Tax=Boothiomyces macroporosus TaxID=261099 RepID=A0AAD5Y8V0_9FUNG|nr:hypothetical protein HK103_000084 [Boothiomyces macroporosus]